MGRDARRLNGRLLRLQLSRERVEWRFLRRGSAPDFQDYLLVVICSGTCNTVLSLRSCGKPAFQSGLGTLHALANQKC